MMPDHTVEIEVALLGNAFFMSELSEKRITHAIYSPPSKILVAESGFTTMPKSTALNSRSTWGSHITGHYVNYIRSMNV